MGRSLFDSRLLKVDTNVLQNVRRKYRKNSCGTMEKSSYCKKKEDSTFHEIAKSFLSHRRHREGPRSFVKRWNVFLGGGGLDLDARKWRRADYTDAVRFIAELRESRAGGTVRGYVTTLRKLYRLLQEYGEVSRNPFSQVETDGANARRRRYHRRLERCELGALMRHVPNSLTGKMDRAAIALMLGQGLRGREALNLQTFDLEGDTILLRETKNGSDAKIVFSGWVKDELLGWMAIRGDERGYIFPRILRPGRKKNMNVAYAATLTAFNRRLAIYCEAAQIEKFTSHSFRVTAITTALESGFTLEEVREFARHSTVSITERYDRRKFRTVTIGNFFTKYDTRNQKRVIDFSNNSIAGPTD